MPSPDFAAQLADLGGFALAIFVTLLVAVALYRRKLVFGWMLDDRDRRIAQLESEMRAWRRLYLDGLTGDHGERADPFSSRGDRGDALG